MRLGKDNVHWRKGTWGSTRSSADLLTCCARRGMRSAFVLVMTGLVACGGTSESTTTESSPTLPTGARLGARVPGEEALVRHFA